MRSPSDFFGGITFVVIFDNTHWEMLFLSRVNSAKFANFLEKFTKFLGTYHIETCKKKNKPW
jgi:hypothetical protein